MAWFGAFEGVRALYQTCIDLRFLLLREIVLHWTKMESLALRMPLGPHPCDFYFLGAFLPIFVYLKGLHFEIDLFQFDTQITAIFLQYVILMLLNALDHLCVFSQHEGRLCRCRTVHWHAPVVSVQNIWNHWNLQLVEAVLQLELASFNVQRLLLNFWNSYWRLMTVSVAQLKLYQFWMVAFDNLWILRILCQLIGRDYIDRGTSINFSSSLILECSNGLALKYLHFLVTIQVLSAGILHATFAFSFWSSAFLVLDWFKWGSL